MTTISARQMATALSGILLSAIGTAQGLPAASSARLTPALERRAIMKGKNYVPLGNTTIPLTPLLLIFCALGFASLALLYAVINVMCTRNRLSRSSRQINEERSQAKQDLRVRGASRSALSPAESPVAGSSSSLESGSKLPPNKIPRRVGGGVGSPRRSSDKRHSRGYRGTSFSLADAGKKGDKSKFGAQGLAVLTTDGLSSGSTMQISPRELETGELGRPPLSVLAGKRGSSLGTQERGLSNGSSSSSNSSGMPTNNGASQLPGFGTRHVYRTSSSVGLGADVRKSRQSMFGNIPVNPSMMDRTYVNPEYGHPLDHSHDLRRHITEPAAGASGSRRNSSYSIYDSSDSHGLLDGRVGYFGQAGSNPLQPLNPSQLGYSSSGSIGGRLNSGASSPLQTGYATPTGSGSAVFGRNPRALPDPGSSRNKSYDSDDGDAITAQSGLLSSGARSPRHI